MALALRKGGWRAEEERPRSREGGEQAAPETCTIHLSAVADQYRRRSPSSWMRGLEGWSMRAADAPRWKEDFGPFGLNSSKQHDNNNDDDDDMPVLTHSAGGAWKSTRSEPNERTSSAVTISQDVLHVLSTSFFSPLLYFCLVHSGRINLRNGGPGRLPRLPSLSPYI